MRENFNNPHLAALVAALCWAGNTIAGRFAVGHVSPMFLTAGRWAVALAILLPFALPHLRRDWPVVRANALYLFSCGAIGYAGFNFLLYSGLQTLPAVEVALEQTAMPIVIVVINYVLFRTKITWLHAVGYFITVLGVAVVLSKGNPLTLIEGKTGLGIGDLYLLGAALCYGGYSVALRMKPQLHWMSFMSCLAVAALVSAVAGAVWESATGDAIFPTTAQGMAVVIFAGVFPSLLAQSLFIYAVERIGPNLAGLYINMVPVFTALLAVIILGEALHGFHAAAFLLVVGGLLIAQRRNKAAQREESAS